ncbi:MULTISPECIES: hypothetical protein [Streptomyces]|uniref:hypothetical protein n=1 Tax=Streptomyces TaxID=1883 RepID=UPI00117F3E0F|nr:MULTISPECIES: hypothetical protein [Streptomyces]MDX3611696.1 hypothetical protein [Streptomyces europaeiscabiei]MDX3632096.1 hypothetical protein [Streptomyces europaeiscabiei]MDX3649810.1 hypothetical protein [Streptomyces europaeiscabiei]MDX3781296.1 hypothetical protein [Streptomyces europaeiscabiei]MDX3834940.1 hypothetical protein [Streptomyces europaeiscabiei]
MDDSPGVSAQHPGGAGIPVALIRPSEWVIAGARWLVGALLLLRLPKVTAGEAAGQSLVAAR